MSILNNLRRIRPLLHITVIARLVPGYCMKADRMKLVYDRTKGAIGYPAVEGNTACPDRLSIPGGFTTGANGSGREKDGHFLVSKLG